MWTYPLGGKRKRCRTSPGTERNFRFRASHRTHRPASFADLTLDRLRSNLEAYHGRFMFSANLFVYFIRWQTSSISCSLDWTQKIQRCCIDLSFVLNSSTASNYEPSKQTPPVLHLKDTFLDTQEPKTRLSGKSKFLCIEEYIGRNGRFKQTNNSIVSIKTIRLEQTAHWNNQRKWTWPLDSEDEDGVIKRLARERDLLYGRTPFSADSTNSVWMKASCWSKLLLK